MVLFIKDDALSTDWFIQGSSNIGIALLGHLGLYYIYKLLVYMFHACHRCNDRSFSYSVVGDPDGDEYLARTKQNAQYHLNEIYTGPEFAGSTVLAHLIILIIPVLCFAAAVPILWFVAFLLLSLFYWISKFNIVKYSKHTFNFNEKLVMDAYNALKYGLWLHLFFSFLVLRNTPALRYKKLSNTDLENLITAKEHLTHDIPADHAHSNT
jgi:hypothetical protein